MRTNQRLTYADSIPSAGIDLGICNTAAVSYGDESVLYPGGALKEDEYYFAKKRAQTDDSASIEA